jgi:hypothetical protein
MSGRNTSATLRTDRLGPPGVRGELHVVAVMVNETRRDEDRLRDTTLRPFKVFARLGKTALIGDTITFEFGPDDGGSYVTLPPDAVAGRARWSGYMMEFKKNKDGEKSLVEFECTANSRMEARAVFMGVALPFLDHLAYVANSPIFVQTIRIEDINNQVQSIDFTSPYRKVSVVGTLEWPMDLAPVFAMYREAKNSHSDFYKFLCYHKILDGLLGTLRANINLRARKQNIDLVKQREVVPSDPEIAAKYQKHVGTPIRRFYDDVLTPQFRNAIAHFITKDGAILNLSDPATMIGYSETMYVSELCVRTMIESHRSLARQLAAEPPPS